MSNFSYVIYKLLLADVGNQMKACSRQLDSLDYLDGLIIHYYKN